MAPPFGPFTSFPRSWGRDPLFVEARGFSRVFHPFHSKFSSREPPPSRERKEKQQRALLRSVVLEERLLQLQQKAAQAPTSNFSTSMEIPCLDSCPLSADLRLQFASSSMELERT